MRPASASPGSGGLGSLVSGAWRGMGGASLSVFLASSFSRNMTAGRGFMALAALIFGNGNPVADRPRLPAVGFAEAVQIRSRV